MLPSMAKADLQGKQVLLREDFNVPMESGCITDTTRLDAAVPTIKQLQNMGAKIILMSHLGRPVEGEFNKEYSLQPVVDYLQDTLKKTIKLFSLDDEIKLGNNEIAMLENVRFYKGEKANDADLSRKFAALADVFVMDAFAVSHRAQASTEGVIRFAKQSYAGPLLEKELHSLQSGLNEAKAPVVAIVGGSKVSSKLDVLNNLIDKVDTIVLGGGIANTFLCAQGISVGASLKENSLINTAKTILSKAQSLGKTIWLPHDVVVANELSKDVKTQVKNCKNILDTDKIFDIGPSSSDELNNIISTARTILWNGPVGVFELEPFAFGTKSLSNAIANSRAFSVAGGGDTIAAINMFNISDKISYISTGGGAFLAWLEGKPLPSVVALQSKYVEQTVT
jgi:phosphoglycerate kinase